MFPRTTFPRLILVLLTLIILSGTTSFISAQCTYDAATDSWGCGTLDDSLTINDTVGGRISLDGGSDTLILDSLARIGTSSTVVNDVVLMGDGDDSVYNDGTIGAVPTGTIQDYQRGLNCGPGDDIIINAGLIDGPVTCDDGADTVINLPGAGALVIGADAGADSLVNSGYLGDLTGASTLIPPQGHLLGGDGDDTLVNLPFATAAGSLIGGSGADSIVNEGYLVGALLGDGDATPGNDTLVNAVNGYASTMDGGAGNDSVVNGGYVAGTLAGGSDNDTIANLAGGQVDFMQGETGADLIMNSGYVGRDPFDSRNIGILDGGDGDDTIVNNQHAFAISMDGGEGSDSLINRSALGWYSVTVSLGPRMPFDGSMLGGAGDDSLINDTGAVAFQMSGGIGNDSIINRGGGRYLIVPFSHQIVPRLPLSGGDGDDTLVNAAGAWASSMEGDGGADSLVNAGYLGGYTAGTLSGGDGSDTVVNTAGAYVRFVDLGAGDDLFTNEGFVNTYGTLGSNYGVDCGDGNDTVNVGGYIIGSILCGGGDDSVTVGPHWLLPGIGSPVIGTLDGGVDSDTLTFAFTVSVGSQTEADDLAAALTAASPAGGTITIAGVPYAWTNFETLVNLLSFTINQPVVITLNGPRRANASDAAAPVAIYCAADAVEVWTVGADGQGSFAFSVPSVDVSAGTSVSADGVSFSASGDGSFSVSATASDGKLYAFTGSCD